MDLCTAPSSLAPDALARRLRELAGAERDAQVDFLLHLDEFDRRLAFREAGYDSLWTYCLQALHLREGPAGRRIGAMRVLRRFPPLESALRDGRLCLSTVTLLGPLLTTHNLDELLARAAYRTKAEVEHLAASLQRRPAPKDGIRKLPERAEPAAVPIPARPSGDPRSDAQTDTLPMTAWTPAPVSTELPPTSPTIHPEPDRSTAEVRPVSRDEWSLRVTIDSELKADLETLKDLLSHTTGGDLAAVLREAIRCGIEKHGKRRGAVKPARERRTSQAQAMPSAASSGQFEVKLEELRPANSRYVPATIRRKVWERDGGRCAWTSDDGHRCGSRWKLELDHVVPAALGGEPTIANLRLTCRAHNVLHAEQVFGRERMAQFGRESGASGTRPGTHERIGSAHPGMSGLVRGR
jgi:5-methylcytosine-specific restriction endonuclease McrA